MKGSDCAAEMADNDKSVAFNNFTVLRLELVKKTAAVGEGVPTVLPRRLTMKRVWHGLRHVAVCLI